MAGYKVLTDYTFTIEREVAWDTLIDTAPVGLPTEDLSIDIEANAHRLNRANGIRGQQEANSWQDTFGVIPTASTSIFMTPQLSQLVLPGMLQSDPDWADATSVWTMFTQNYADLPSPKSDNGGYYYDLVRNSPEATDDEVLTGAVPSSMKFTLGPTDNDGILVNEIEFIGATYARGQVASGTITDAPLTDMYRWGNLVAVSFDGNDLLADFTSFEINLTNGTKLANDLPTGEVVFPKWEVTGSFDIIAGSTTETMKDLVLDSDVNTGKVLKFAFGTSATTPAAEGDLIITVFSYLTEWSSDFTEGEVITFSFEGVFGDSGASEYPFQAKFFNA